jgi:hypothetical protein
MGGILADASTQSHTPDEPVLQRARSRVIDGEMNGDVFKLDTRHFR